MLSDVVDLLACPHCRRPLVQCDRTVRCSAGHTFDIARQGYVNLRSGRRTVGTADTADMVAARSAFLDAGHYAPITRLVVSAAADTVRDAGAVIDVGAGPGHHLASVLDARPDRRGLALDLSTYAARRAARCHPRAGAVVCDVWRDLPVRPATAAAALSIFAPRNAAEIARVLTARGALVVVTPLPTHLTELIGALDLLRVDADKPDRLRRQLAPAFVREAEERLTYALALSRADVATVVRMGPSAWHINGAALAERTAALPEPVEVTVAVRLSVHRRRDEPRRR